MRSVAVVVALAACLHAGVWALRQTQASAPGFDGILNSVSYSPFTTAVHPDLEGSRPPEERIRAELKAIAPYARAIRLYSSTGGVEQVPKIAAEFGLKVTLGIWLDKTDRRTDKDPPPEFDPGCKNRLERDMAGVLNVKCTSRNIREITSAVDLLRKNRNVNGVMVGNETLFRRDLTADQLAEVVKRVKREVGGTVPVSTGEIYSELLGPDDEDADQPKPSNALNLFQKLSGDAAELQDPKERALAAERLVSTVDFVAVHVLPYWGGIPAENAVDATVKIYAKLREKFKGKRIVIAEFGWPSSGYNRRAAVPGKFEQAAIMRSFVARAHALGIDYNLIEAYDQPWKTIEGSVGAYWGLFDNQTRQPKFVWAGPITDADSWKIAAVAVAVGVLLSLPVLGIAGATAGQALLLASAAHAVGAWAATVFDYWVSHYFVAGAAFALALGTLLLIPLVLIALGRIEEIAGILLGRSPARLFKKAAGGATDYAPKVSIHIPAYREPPEMLKATLDAVARLAYPNFECIIVVNNTPDEAMWRPVEEHCRTLGERFRFVNAPKLEGYKAGALRLALAHTAPDAEIVGVIDADYAVTPDWLADLVPVFADAKVALVQAPQDHRDGRRSPLHHTMNGEYAGFFDIGMVQRNEANAIIVHGTMCLIRRAALEAAGGWSSDTICDDTDLGLTILELGWQAHYTNRRYGWGLLPQDYMAFRTQRSRWAGGAVQIIKKHWRRFLPGTSLLDRDQKREFAFGWLSWFGAEIIAVAAAMLNLIWVPFVAFKIVAIPDPLLTLPIISAFLVSLAHFVCLYRLRVAVPYRQMLGAMVVFMSVQWTIASAAFQAALPASSNYFHRTRKGKGAVVGTRIMTMPETVLGALLVVGSITIYATNFYRVLEADLFATILLIQSLPFLSAVALVWLERLGEARSSKMAAVRPAAWTK